MSFVGPQHFRNILSIQCLLPAASAQKKMGFLSPSRCLPPPALKPRKGVAGLLTLDAARSCPRCHGARGAAATCRPAACGRQLLLFCSARQGKLCCFTQPKSAWRRKKPTALQKYYWEQTQNGKSTSSVPLLIYFF